ncbi:unnamed protein product, partial [Ectocarpus sp. 13 AM-2016]
MVSQSTDSSDPTEWKCGCAGVMKRTTRTAWTPAVETRGSCLTWMGSRTDTTTRGFDGAFFPFTTNYYRGCCPSGVTRYVEACGSSATAGFTDDSTAAVV